jgi:hypothetical protein
MKALAAIGAEIFGLFVDSGSFALAILIWVGIVAAMLRYGVGAIAHPSLLLFGGLAVLLAGSAVLRARQ